MKAKMTKDQARKFVNRWKMVREAEKAELRRTPISIKMQQLAALMASAGQFGWEAKQESEEVEVRRRWAKLRQAEGG